MAESINYTSIKRKKGRKKEGGRKGGGREEGRKEGRERKAERARYLLEREKNKIIF